MHTTVINQRN